MKVRTQDLIETALDWAVAKCEGYAATIKLTDVVYVHPNGEWHHNGNWIPSTNWAQGGPIIERERIGLDQFKGHECRAYLGTPVQYEHAMFAPEGEPLIAAMRCYVASKLGDEVDIPDELV